MTASIEIPALDSREKFEEFVKVTKIGRVKYESLRKSFNCSVNGMKEAPGIVSTMVRPALAVSRRLFTQEDEEERKCASMRPMPELVSAFQGIRHGVVIVADGGAAVYYVGGRSPYWVLRTGLYVWSYWPPLSYLVFNPYEGDLPKRFQFHYMTCMDENSFNYPNLVALRVLDLIFRDITYMKYRELLKKYTEEYMAVLSGAELGVGEIAGALVPNYVPVFASRPLSDVLFGYTKFRARTGHLISILNWAEERFSSTVFPFFAVLHRPDNDTVYAYVLTTAHVQEGLCMHFFDESGYGRSFCDLLSYDDPSKDSDFLKYSQVYGYFKESLIGAPVFVGSPRCDSVRLVGFLERVEGTFQVGGAEFVKYRVFPWKGVEDKNFKMEMVESLAWSLGTEELYDTSEFLVGSAVEAFDKLIKKYGVDHKLAKLAVLLSHWHTESSRTASEASMHMRALIMIRDYLKRVALSKMDFYREHIVVETINDCMAEEILRMLDSESAGLDPGEYVIGPSPRLIKRLLECVRYTAVWSHG